MLSERESGIHFYLFRNEADSFSSMLQLTNLKFTFITINVPLFKKRRDIIFFLRDSLRGQKSLCPLKMSLEMAHKVIVPQKKIMSQSFLNSGTLVILCTRVLLLCVVVCCCV
jgi:hypothetical protein